MPLTYLSPKCDVPLIYFFHPRCDILTYLSHLLLVLNSSMNIVIYCWKVACLEDHQNIFIQFFFGNKYSQAIFFGIDIILFWHQNMFMSYFLASINVHVILLRTRSSGEPWSGFSPHSKLEEVFQSARLLHQTISSTPKGGEAVGLWKRRRMKTCDKKFHPWWPRSPSLLPQLKCNSSWITLIWNHYPTFVEYNVFKDYVFMVIVISTTISFVMVLCYNIWTTVEVPVTDYYFMINLIWGRKTPGTCDKGKHKFQPAKNFKGKLRRTKKIWSFNNFEIIFFKKYLAVPKFW